MPKDHATPMGFEIEAFVYDRNGNPIDLHEWFKENGEPTDGDDYGCVTTDGGRNQLEIITDPLIDTKEHEDQLQRLYDQLPREWVVDFRPFARKGLPKNGSDLSHEWASKVRYRVIHEALRQEARTRNIPDAWLGVHRMIRCAATHVTFPIDPKSHEGLLFMNIINNVAPYMSAQVGKQYGINNRGHLAMWREFARPDRFPSPDLWFATAESFEEHFTSIPRLIRCDTVDKKDVWSVDLVRGQDLEDPASCGATWWPCRPKPGKLVEVRCAPSMPFLQALAFGDEIRHIAYIIFQEVSGKCYESPDDAHEIFRVLASHSDLIPVRPLTPRRWQKTLHW